MNENQRHIFSGMKALVNYRWLTGQAIVVEAGKIKAIIPDEMIKNHLPASHHQFSKNHFFVPGFIDIHIHGANGKDVMDAEIAAFDVISEALAAEGVTGYLATTMTAKRNDIEKVLELIPAAMMSKKGAAILGVHLEGPFIAKSKMGAQGEPDILQPEESLVRQWQNLSQGNIKLITLAPELSGALDLIQALKKMNIIISIGHTDAGYAETMAGIEAGCSQATHLFNAMRGIHQREPGATGALLLSKKITAELIVDGIHLHPAIVDMAFRLKSKEGLILVTDAIRAKCLGDGQYNLSGQTVDVQQGRATLKNGVLAGSTLRMPQAIKNMVNFTGVSLEDAIYMASMNPARKLGIDRQKGNIEVGMDADIVILDSAFDVTYTMRAGVQV